MGLKIQNIFQLLCFFFSINNGLALNSDFNCTSKPNGLYPNPESCTTFYYCSNENTYLYDCPEGLHYNPENQVKFTFH